MNYLMMSNDELTDLRRRARRGWIMFGVGVLLLVGASFVSGYHVGKQRTYEQAAEAIDLMYTEQKSIYAHASQVQKSAEVERQVVIDAAHAVRQREEFISYNQENACPDLQKAMAKRGR